MAAAHELLKEGHSVTGELCCRSMNGMLASKRQAPECTPPHSRAPAFAAVLEKGDEVGGTWIYTEDVEEHPLNGGRRVHSSMYHGLRTNLPREIMGFSELPFLPGCFPGSSDPRQFPGHQEVG